MRIIFVRGIRIFNEIKRFIESWIFIPADRLIDISEREKSLESQLSRKRKASNDLIDQMCDITGVRDINFDEKNGKLISYISDWPGISIELASLGSGFQQIFAMYPQFFQQYIDNTVFFIEEPEAHLHPLLQRKLLQIFSNRSESNQFFITTHSTIFCRHEKNRIKPHLVMKNGPVTMIKELGGEEMNEIKSALGHVNTDLFGYNAVVFVEGQTEYKTMPLLAANLDIDIVNDGIILVDSEGYGNMIQIKNVINLFKNTSTEVYALSDNHVSEQRKLRDLEDNLDQKNYVKLDKNFEGSFDKEVLIHALKENRIEE